jgi:hypothetical protein
VTIDFVGSASNLGGPTTPTSTAALERYQNGQIFFGDSDHPLPSHLSPLQTSQAARDQKKFTDYNQRCTVHERSRQFAERLNNLIKGIRETIPIKTLAFFSDACDLLIRCYRVHIIIIILLL